MKDNLSFYESPQEKKEIAILSIPLEYGSDERGLAHAPKYLIESGLEKVITRLGHKVARSARVSAAKPPHEAFAGSMKNVREIVSVAKRSSTVVERAAKAGETVIALGGDHSIAIGTIAGAAAANQSLGVIYIDAHPDCHTDATTITGNVHGMVTATLMGEGHRILTDVLKRKIAPEHFLFVGLKDFDQAEIEYLRSHDCKVFTMLDIVERGLAPIIRAIESLSKKVDKVWISMDMDSIDAEYAPGVGLQNQGGLTRREVLSLAQYVGKACDIAGLDIVEVSPQRDVDAKTARLALEIVARFLGGEYSWYQNTYIDTYRETNVTPERNPIALEAAPNSRRG